MSLRTLRLRVADMSEDAVTLEPDHGFPLQKGFGSITLSPLAAPNWQNLQQGEVMEFIQSDDPFPWP